VIISSIVLFFRRDSCGAGPVVDVPSGAQVEAPSPLADVVTGAAAEVVLGAVAGAVVLVVFPTLPKRLDVCAGADVTGAEVVGVEVAAPVGLAKELNKLGVCIGAVVVVEPELVVTEVVALVDFPRPLKRLVLELAAVLLPKRPVD
jgi:hypothetical protein